MVEAARVDVVDVEAVEARAETAPLWCVCSMRVLQFDVSVLQFDVGVGVGVFVLAVLVTA